MDGNRSAVRLLCEHLFVRWDNLKAGSPGPATLPGLDRGTVTRTFDAPEAVGIRFHEIEARSAINDVGPMSYVDFRHTINPYRGCTHACSFCTGGETRVLRGDGRTTGIADLRVGDEIYGTRFEGRYRRYVKTCVLDHWETKKPAYAIQLENGTELIASGDHRFLSDRGWKYVVGTKQGTARRPHLLLGDSVLGLEPGNLPADLNDRPKPTPVVEIEPLGRQMEMFDITTGTGDFIADGVISHNCFARPTHKYLDLNAARGLRARDRRQGQPAGGPAGGAAAAVLEGRARSRSAPTPTRISGSRVATGSRGRSGRRCWRRGTRARC